MMTPSDFQPPAGYQPYDSVWLCGNQLIGVKVIFQIGTNVPFVVGKGNGKHPLIWLSGPSVAGSWVEIVSANKVVRSIVPLGQRVAVLQDAVEPLTVVMVGTTVVLNALGADGNEARIPNVDFRPIGLNIFGDEDEGLSFGGNRFVKNAFKRIGTAFAANFGGPT